MGDISEEGTAELAGFPCALLDWEAGVQGEADGGAQTTALREKSESAVEGRFWREWVAKPSAFRSPVSLEKEGSGQPQGRREYTFVGVGGGVDVGPLVKRGRTQRDKQYSSGMS